MELWLEKKLSFGELLKLTFSIVKSNFMKLFLFVLCLTGPFYVLIILIYGKFSIFGITLGSFDTSNGLKYVNLVLSDLPLLVFILLITAIIMLVFVAIPLAIASIVIFVGSLKEGETISFGQVIKKAFSLYWKLFRGSFVYFIFPFLVLFFLIIVPVLMTFIEGVPMWAKSLTLITITITPTLIYLLTRMSFYFAFIIFEKDITGVISVKKSWELLKDKKTLKLIGLYFFIIIVDALVIVLFKLIFGDSNITILLDKIVFMILLPINVVYYTVIFFDFLKFNEKTVVAS